MKDSPVNPTHLSRPIGKAISIGIPQNGAQALWSKTTAERKPTQELRLNPICLPSTAAVDSLGHPSVCIRPAYVLHALKYPLGIAAWLALVLGTFKSCSNDGTGRPMPPFSKTKTTIFVIIMPILTAAPARALTLCLLLF